MDSIENPHVRFCPYVGLQPYTETERDYFFGRERDSRIISSNLYAASLTVLYGASGVGKSSVLRAGVVPRLRASPRTAVILFDGWSDKALLNTLKTRCAEAIVIAGKNAQIDINLPFDEFLLSATQAFGGTILVIFDQFEEYFLYHPESEKDNTFDAEFARAVNREEIDANFLLSMREDALSRLDRFRSRIPNIVSNSIRLRHLDGKSARDAIRNPLQIYNEQHSNEPGVSVEDLLVKRLIEEVRAGKLAIGQVGRGAFEEANATTEEEIQIETPFLQLVLTRLWDEEMKRGSRVLQLATLNALGGAGRIVRTHMDAAMNTLSKVEQEVAAGIFRYLVTPSGTKIAYTVPDLEYYAKPNQPLGPVLEKLARGNVRILRPVTSPGEPGVLRYEIYHDVLALAVLDWRARYETSRELAQERVSWRQQVRSLLLWALWGALVDLLLPIVISGIIFYYQFQQFSLNNPSFDRSILLVALFVFLFFLFPPGVLLYVWGLRKVRPPFSRRHLLSIALAWSLSHALSFILLSYFLYGALPEVVKLIAIGLGSIGYFLSGPIGGFLAYWQISKARERQMSPIGFQAESENLSRKYIQDGQKMRL